MIIVGLYVNIRAIIQYFVWEQAFTIMDAEGFYVIDFTKEAKDVVLTDTKSCERYPDPNV